MLDSVSKRGLEGLQRGFEHAGKAAEQITNAAATGQADKLVDGFVELSRAEFEVKANSKVIKAAKKMDEDIIDILA